MDENERYLVAVHDLEDALNKDLHDSVVEHNQNENLTNEDIKNILDDIRSATDRFTNAENKSIIQFGQKKTLTNTELSGMDSTVDTKSLESCGSRRSGTRDNVSIEFTPLTLRQEPGKYQKIYPIFSPTPSQTEAHVGHPVRPVYSSFFPKRLADMELKTKSTLSKLNRIHQQKNRMLALERIEASIKKNMRRL